MKISVLFLLAFQGTAVLAGGPLVQESTARGVVRIMKGVTEEWIEAWNSHNLVRIFSDHFRRRRARTANPPTRVRTDNGSGATTVAMPAMDLMAGFSMKPQDVKSVPSNLAIRAAVAVAPPR